MPRIDEKAYALIPVYYMREAAYNYFEHRRPSGHFFMALVRNDLIEAHSRADLENRRHLDDWIQWLHNHAPIGSYGSDANVRKWLTPPTPTPTENADVG